MPYWPDQGIAAEALHAAYALGRTPALQAMLERLAAFQGTATVENMVGMGQLAGVADNTPFEARWRATRMPHGYRHPWRRRSGSSWRAVPRSS